MSIIKKSAISSQSLSSCEESNTKHLKVVPEPFSACSAETMDESPAVFSDDEQPK
tara:strand:+ start:86 stop:250 length:165 start_codon:yes stop_codon:yes gene_type:complete